MDNAQQPSENEQAPYLRLPWPVVAAALAGVLLIALAAGLLANRYLRPQAGLAPTSVALAAGVSTTPISYSTPAGYSTPQPTPALLATTASTPRPTSGAPTIISSTPTAMPATPLPTSTASPASPTPSATTPRPTVSPELATEVSDAYKQYWQVRAEALYDLDTSRLPTVMAGDHLAAIEKLIAQLHIEGRSIRTNVDHTFSVFDGSVNEAKVSDTYIDNSVYVDLQTREVLGPPTDDVLDEQYTMDKIDGSWRIVSLVRAQ